MPKALGRNKHQKAAHRPGEVKVSRAQVGELLELSCSADADERLTAAKFMCPCHIRGRIPEVWSAIYRLMEDDDRRVRFAAWHTLEDGGLPSEPDALGGRIAARELTQQMQRLAPQGTTEGSLFVPSSYLSVPLMQ